MKQYVVEVADSQGRYWWGLHGHRSGPFYNRRAAESYAVACAPLAAWIVVEDIDGDEDVDEDEE